MAPETKNHEIAQISDNTMDTPSPKSLLGLPAELRNRIYRFAVSADGRIPITTSAGFTEPPLLLTSKAIRQEAIGIYYLENDFDLVVVSWDPSIYSLQVQKAESMWNNYKIDLLNQIKVRILRRGHTSWKNFKRWMRMHYDERVDEAGPMLEPTKTASLPPMQKIMVGMFVVANRMKASPWDEVEQVLELLRPGMVSLDAAWGLDQ
jgi:hypothetical protein